jgi:hypothetical protein
MSRLHTSRSLLKLMSPRLLALGLCSLLGATSAHATLLVYEGFDYTAGTNTASATGTATGPITSTGVAASGTGLTGSWTMNRGATASTPATTNLSGTSFTTTAPLTLSGLSSSNSRLQWTGQGSSSNTNYLTASLTADVSTALTVNKTSQIWLSYLVKTDAFATNGGIYLGKSNSADASGTMTGTNSLIGFGYNSTGNAVITSGGGAGSNTKATSGTAQFGTAGTMKWVVANFSFTSAGIDSANIWVRDTYTGTEGDLGTAAATFTPTSAIPVFNGVSGGVVATATQLVFTTGSSGAKVGFDEVRIGTTFLDVAPSASPIPEPSSAAFIAAGACGLLVCLRRRRSTN